MSDPDDLAVTGHPKGGRPKKLVVTDPIARSSLNEAERHANLAKREMNKAIAADDSVLAAKWAAERRNALDSVARLRGDLTRAITPYGLPTQEVERIIQAHRALSDVSPHETAQQAKQYLLAYNAAYPDSAQWVIRQRPKRFEPVTEGDGQAT